MKRIELTEHFTYGKLLRYAIPSIGNMLAIMAFQLVDGYFVSNMLGGNAFAAVNLISPIFLILYSLGFMFGTGASAVVSRHMGENHTQKAKEIFSCTTVVMIITGLILGVLGALLLPSVAPLLGATDETLDYCITYGRILLLFLAAFIVSAAFQSLWLIAGKAIMGVIVSSVTGASNVFMDWFFMGPMKMGVKGAALATSFSALISMIFILVYFKDTSHSELCFVRFKMHIIKKLLMICYNGASEMISALATNITMLLINGQLMKLYGETGVEAMGVFNYVTGVFMAYFFGLCTTMLTVIGFKVGEKDKVEIDNLKKQGFVLMLTGGVLMILICQIFVRPISNVFVGYDADTLELTIHCLQISAFAYLLYGFDIFSDTFFTALGDGLSSIIISAMLSLVMPIALIFFLPAVFGREAIWYTFPLMTVFTAILCVFMFHFRYKKVDSAPL